MNANVSNVEGIASGGGKPFAGVIVAEGEIEGVVRFATREELDAYGEGLSRGAGLYGAGDCQLVTEDFVALEEFSEWPEGLARECIDALTHGRGRED